MPRFIGGIGEQFFDDAGDPLIDGKLYFFNSGTNDPLTTYADADESIANPNPVILSGAGRMPNIFFSGSARSVLTNMDDVQIEVRDPVGTATTPDQLAPWLGTVAYDFNDLVRGSDDRYYQSTVANNLGHDPTTTSGFWQEILLTGVWDASYPYQTGYMVIASNLILYISQVDNNIGNDPILGGSEWASVAGNVSGSGPVLDEEITVFDGTSGTLIKGGGARSVSGAVQAVDGTVSLPGHTFISEPSTGRYLAGPGDMRDAVLGVDAAFYTNQGQVVTATGGTTAATLKDRFGDIKNAWRDFGIVGDGATDIRQLASDAIASMSSAGGGILYFPPGVYMVARGVDATGIDFRSNVLLVGAGPGATIIRGMPSTGNVHLLSNSIKNQLNIGVMNMTLDHNGVVLGATTEVECLRMDECHQVWLQNLAVLNTDHHGILTQSQGNEATPGLNSDVFVDRIYGYNIGVSGRDGGDLIRVFNATDRSVISNIIADGVEHHGIHVGLGQCTVSNCVLKDCVDVGVFVNSEGAQVSNIDISVHMIVDNFASRPAAGVPGRIFRAEDTQTTYRDNGTAWFVVGANPRGVSCITRDPPPTFAPAQRILLGNIKVVQTLTENVTYAPTTGSSAFEIDSDRTKLTNFEVEGKFQYGAEITGDNVSLSHGDINGVRQHGVRIGTTSRAKVLDVNVLSAGVQAASTYAGIFLSSASKAKIMMCDVDDTGLAAGLQTTSGTADCMITMNDIPNMALLGSRHMVRFNKGEVRENSGLASAVAPDGSGLASIAHNMSATPDVPNAWIKDGANVKAIVRNANSSTINIEFRQADTGALVTTGTFDVYWSGEEPFGVT